MNVLVFIVSFFVLQFVCLYIGKKASKQLETQDDYFLAGRNIRFFPLLMTLVATQIGGGLILGSAEEAYRYGWYVLLYPFGASLGLILLAAGVGKRLSQFNVSTIAQLFEVVYKSSALKKVASLLSIISLFMILMAQVIASKKFMVSAGVTQNWIFVAFWGIVILYTVSGGLKAVVATDIVQALFFIIIFIASGVYTFYVNQGGIPVVSSESHFEFDQSKWMGWLLMPLLFMVIEQDMAQRCFAAKSGKVVSWASAVAALCIILVCIIPVYYGILAKSLGLVVPEGESVLMAFLTQKTSPAITALFGCAILAAIISTADSLINAISSNIAQDFELAIFQRKNSVRASQMATMAIGCLALLASFSFNNVVEMLILSYELSVSCLFVPVFAAIFLREGIHSAATYSIFGGALGFVLFHLFPLEMVPREVASLSMSAMGYAFGYLRHRVSSRAIGRLAE